MIALRDYQQRGVTEIRRAYSSGFKAPLYVAPCGAGKTVLFAYIAANARIRNKSTIICVHRQELLRQTAATLGKFDVPYGVIAASRISGAAYSKKTEFPELIQVASVQTLARRIDKIAPPKLLVLDEAHHATAGTWRNIVASYPDAKILGVTATPWRMNGDGLSEIFDTLIPGPSVEELIAGGWLAKPTYYVPPQVADFADVPRRASDYALDALAERLDKPHITGDAVAHYIKICSAAPAVAFCANIRHAEHVAEEFRRQGIPAASIDGSLSDGERAGRIADLASGWIRVLTSCELISEGFDLPAITAAIMLRPTQSLAVWIQQAGRALRPSPGKERAIILDHVGNTERHGLVEDVRDWSLAGRSKRERKVANDNFPEFRRCPQCFVVYPPSRKSCPECGADAVPTRREIEQREGELQELQCQIKQKTARREMAMAQTFEELRDLGRKRGYKNPTGWAWNVYNARKNKRIAA